MVSFGRELYAVWHIFIAGSPDVPNTYLRRLSDEGEPLEPSRPLFDALTTRVALAPSYSGRTIASYCERDADSLDHPGSQFLDADGRPLGIVPERGDADTRCNTPTNVVWTGERHLFARTRIGGGTWLEVAGRDGESLGVEELDWSWGTGWGWGSNLLVDAFDGTRAWSFFMEEGSRNVSVLAIDARGGHERYTLAEPLAPPDAGPWGGGGNASVLADEHGVIVGFVQYLRTDGGRDGVELRLGLFRYDVDERALVPLGGLPVNVEGQPRILRRSADELLLVSADASRSMVGLPQVEVHRATGEGELLASWVLESPGDDGIRGVDVHTHLGRVFVGYVRVLDFGQTRIELLELGCTP